MKAQVLVTYGPQTGPTFVARVEVDSFGKSDEEIQNEAARRVLLNLGEEVKEAVLD